MNENLRGNNNQGNQKSDYKPARITVDKPDVFGGTLSSQLTTTDKIGKKINKLFGSVFSDYYGCTIIVDNYGRLVLSCYFKDNMIQDTDKVKAFVVSGTAPKSAGIMERIGAINSRMNSKKYTITQDAKEMLSEFFAVPRGKQPEWNKALVEECEPLSMGGLAIYSKVMYMDLNRIIKKIYGRFKDDEDIEQQASNHRGDKVDYQILPIKPLNTAMQGMPNANWLVSIQQLNSSELEKVASEIGIMPTVGRIPMITGL